MEQILNQIFRMVSRRLVGRGVNAGIDYVARGGRRAEDMSAQERAQAQHARQATKRARQAAKLMRRLR